jgi:predicted XRE-type DNA-binding protein
MAIKIRNSASNVCRDLGFPREKAENLKVRADLLIQISTLIRSRRLTQAQAAGLFGVTRPRVSALIRGKIEGFSIETLVAMLAPAGIQVQFTLG